MFPASKLGNINTFASPFNGLVGAFEAATSGMIAASNCNYIEKYTRKFNYPENSRIKSKEDLQEMGIKTFFCSNVCAAYKRNIYEKAGGFCKKTIFNEDMILAGHMINAGYKVAYVAEARVIHSHNYTGMQQFHRNFDLAVSQTAHPEIFEQVSSEAEGMRLVKNTMGYLCKIHKPYLIWKLGWQCVGTPAIFWENAIRSLADGRS